MDTTVITDEAVIVSKQDTLDCNEKVRKAYLTDVANQLSHNVHKTYGEEHKHVNLTQETGDLWRMKRVVLANCNVSNRSNHTCQEFFSSPPRPDRLWAPPNFLSIVPENLSLGVKRPVSEADH
jgi:hypothetical protein